MSLVYLSTGTGKRSVNATAQFSGDVFFLILNKLNKLNNKISVSRKRVGQKI